MDNPYFVSAARRYMEDTYGKAFIINYEASSSSVLVFDSVDQQGKMYHRISLPLPDWDILSVRSLVIKCSGEEVNLIVSD